MGDGDGAGPAELQPIIARLRDIERKCAAMGSRNEEFPMVRARVVAVIARLEAAAGPGGDTTGCSALARELFPVARVFESVGMMAVGREIAHIERSLRALDPAPPPTPAAPARQDPAEPSAAARELSGATPALPPRRARVGAPVVVSMILLLVAVATAASIVLRLGPAARLLGRAPTPIAPAAAAAAPAPSAREATPAPLPSPSPLPLPTRVVTDVGRLQDLISNARLALAHGDLEAAAAQLAEASLIDRRNDALAEIGTRLVDLFLAAAEQAAASGQWDLAAERVERARGMVMRFSLDEVAVRATEQRIAAMDRFQLLSPQNQGALLAARGRRAEVRMRDGTQHSGILDGVEGGALRLQVLRELGGGGLHYSTELPLAEIVEIKVFVD